MENRYHQLNLKSLGILSVCFALFLDKFTLNRVISSIHCIDIRCHSGWVGGKGGQLDESQGVSNPYDFKPRKVALIIFTKLLLKI